MSVPVPPSLATHAGARRLHAALGAALLVLVVLAAAGLLREARLWWAAANDWTHHAVFVEGLADEDWVEVELPAATAAALPGLRAPAHGIALRDDHVRRLVPSPPYFGSGLRDEVTLAQDPADAGTLRLLDPMAIAVPLLGQAVLLAVLGVAAWGWRLLPWGRDQTWSGGRWVDSAGTAHRAGLAAVPEGELREPAEHFAGTRFWAVVIVLLSAGGIVMAIVEGARSPVESVAVLLVLALAAGLMLHVFVSTRTRRWRFDAQGLADGSWFQTRRFPWAAVAAFEKVNANASAQQSYDEDWRAGRARTSTRRRPRDIWQWELRAADGTVLTRLPAELEGTPAFEALCQRLAQRIPAAALVPPRVEDEGAERVGADEGDEPAFDGDEAAIDDRLDAALDASLDPAARAEQEAAYARFVQHERRFLRGAAVTAALILMLFLLPTLWGTFNALRWMAFSERVEARVVERGQARRAPPLTIAWRGTDGAERRIVTGGSDLYAELVPGSAVTVLVRGEGPDDARMDHFLEIWLLPTIGWVLCAVVGIPMWIAGRSLARRSTTRSVARSAAGSAAR